MCSKLTAYTYKCTLTYMQRPQSHLYTLYISRFCVCVCVIKMKNLYFPPGCWYKNMYRVRYLCKTAIMHAHMHIHPHAHRMNLSHSIMPVMRGMIELWRCCSRPGLKWSCMERQVAWNNCELNPSCTGLNWNMTLLCPQCLGGSQHTCNKLNLLHTSCKWQISKL